MMELDQVRPQFWVHLPARPCAVNVGGKTPIALW